MRFCLVAGVAMLGTSAVFAAEPVKVVPVATKVIGTENGRFVFGQISEYRADRYMLDTKTGRLYQLTTRQVRDANGRVIAGSEVDYLAPVPYQDDSGKMSFTPEAADTKDKK